MLSFVGCRYIVGISVVFPEPDFAKPSSPGFTFLIVLMNVDFQVVHRPVIANFTRSCVHSFSLSLMNSDTATGPLFSINRRLPRLALTSYMFPVRQHTPLIVPFPC